MFAKTLGSTTYGLEGVIVNVEVDIANGIPNFEIVGLPDPSVRESRERVRAAIKNAGFKFPSQRITINLAPADLKKDSSGLDLPIAIGILAADGQIAPEQINNCLFASELSLAGSLRGISGILPVALTALARGIDNIFVAPANCQEALLTGITVYAPDKLNQIIMHLSGEQKIMPAVTTNDYPDIPAPKRDDFADIQGQSVARRALEIAAAGGHNVLMVGPPGSGKTMLARRITSILPSLTQKESLEVSKIYSIAGMLKNKAGLITERPFRSPHHTISDGGMVGGGKIPRPGEITLSHNGVLFLDELPEFPRGVLEALRQPLEEGNITISRVNASFTYPAKFIMIAAMNPCPCGWQSDPDHECSCSVSDIRRYTKKISGPLLDRIDINIHVPRLSYDELTNKTRNETSAQIRQRVVTARVKQQERFSKYGFFCNGQMSHKHLKAFCPITTEAQSLLQKVYTQLGLTARSYDRLIRVGRTIADLAGEDIITGQHLAEAIHFRNSAGNLY